MTPWRDWRVFKLFCLRSAGNYRHGTQTEG